MAVALAPFKLVFDLEAIETTFAPETGCKLIDPTTGWPYANLVGTTFTLVFPDRIDAGGYDFDEEWHISGGQNFATLHIAGMKPLTDGVAYVNLDLQIEYWPNPKPDFY